MKREHPSFFRLSIRPWGLLTAAGTIACVATVLGFLGRLSWFLDLFSHFRVQYLLGLPLLGLVMLVGRRRKMGVIFLVFAFVNLVLVAPIYFDRQDVPPGAAPVLRAMLLNVNTRAGDPVRVKQVISKFDPDILVLEEISAKWTSDLAWLTNSHPHSCIRAREDNFGIGLYSKLPLARGKIVYIGGTEVPSVLATIQTGPADIYVIATHPLPPGNADYTERRNEQIGDLPNYVPSSGPVLLLGDLNVTPWNHHFRRLLKRTGLIDSSKGRGVQPTWPNFNLLLRIPIDHCLHSPDIAVIRKEIGPDVGSDHFSVVVDFVVRKGGPADEVRSNI